MGTRIVHLSDLHLGVRHSAERMVLLVDRLLARFADAPPVIVISGDIVENPFRSDPYALMEPHLQRLRAAGFPVLLIPGNHDYGLGIFNWPPCERWFRKQFLPHPEQGYPRLDRIGDTAFLGLDSNAAELHWYDMWFPNGELGNAQLQRLQALLATPEVLSARHRVLYLHHHPNDSGAFMGLKDWRALHRIIDQPALFSAVLFGHRHLVDPKGKASIHPLLHIPRVYDAGASLGKSGYPQGPHRLMDLDLPPDTDLDLQLLSDSAPDTAKMQQNSP